MSASASPRPDSATLEDVNLQLDRFDVAEARSLLAGEIGRLHMVEECGPWTPTGRSQPFDDLPTTDLYAGRDGGTDAIGVLCRAHWLTVIACRVMDLNGEDFDEVDDWRDVDPDVRHTLASATWPGRPDSERRGALTSLLPLLSIVLEVLDIRAERDEVSVFLSDVHLISEYLPLLASQTMLGNAGEPATIRDRLTSARHQWDTDEWRCAKRHDARGVVNESDRALAMWNELRSPNAWRNYLAHRHTTAGSLLAFCATGSVHMPNPGGRALSGCGRRCDVMADAHLDGDYPYRLAAARIFSVSPIVRLRHVSPSGHYFKVPDEQEITSAWKRTREQLISASTEWPIHTSLAETTPGALPGLSAILGTVAGLGRPLPEAGVMERLRDGARALLDQADRAARS